LTENQQDHISGGSVGDEGGDRHPQTAADPKKTATPAMLLLRTKWQFFLEDKDGFERT